MASCEAEVAKIGSKLEKVVNGAKSEDDAHELLDALTKLPVTLDILTKTQIGRKINDFRKKVTDEKLSKKAKTIIKNWKNLLSDKDEGVKEKDSEREKLPRTDSNLSTKSSSSEATLPPAPSAPISKPSNSSFASSTFPPKHLANDDIRLKSAQMVINALRNADLPHGTHDPEDIAVAIEAELFSVHKGTTDKYKAALRSRVFNLRDKKNPALRENVLTGVVKPQKFAVMTSEEMASDEVKKQREKFNEEAIRDAQMSTQQGTPSDMFKCGKCGKKNCTYTQLQTRSSDEPMTTFVYCLECGNRWKFC